MLEHLIALALLFSDAPPGAIAPPGVQAAFGDLCRALEIEDAASGYWYATWWEYRVWAARGQWALLKDAPPAADFARLPPHDVAMSWSQSSCQARALLLARASLGGAARDHLLAALDDDRPRHGALESLAEASNDGLALPTRRAALARLRHLIGPAAYGRGEWPCSVPLHLLPRVP